MYIPAIVQDLGSSKSRSRSSRTQQYAAVARSIFPAHILNYRRYRSIITFILLLNFSNTAVYASHIQTDEVYLQEIANYKVSYAGEHIKNYISNSGHAKNKTREMLSEVGAELFYNPAFNFDTDKSKIEGNQGIDLFYEDDHHCSEDTDVIVHE